MGLLPIYEQYLAYAQGCIEKGKFPLSYEEYLEEIKKLREEVEALVHPEKER